MPSPNQKRSEPEGLNFIFLTIPQQTLLQLSAGSALIAMLSGKAVAETLQAIGQASEEVFRGDRLPMLKFPVEKESESG
jgi:hypothetical protein